MATITRRAVLVADTVAPFVTAGAQARTAWPNKPIRWVVPYTAGA